MDWAAIADQFCRSEAAHGFISKPIPGGHTFTWPTVLGRLLSEAEMRFGPRDYRWTILGVEFSEEQIAPSIWFPGNSGHVSIILTKEARAIPAIGFFQLAHEVVHLLAPIFGAPAPNIEEGVATMFAHDVVGRFGSLPPYEEAERQVRALEAYSPWSIRLLREKEPSFGSLTPDLICCVLPSTPAELAKALCDLFCGPLQADTAPGTGHPSPAAPGSSDAVGGDAPADREADGSAGRAP